MTNSGEREVRVRAAVDAAGRGLVGRATLLELVVLCAVAREHLLVIGPPGTAKSAAVRRMAHGLGGTYFEYLVGRFTEPSEVFGPVNLQKLREGLVETETSGMLPEADIAFLDEIFLGSTAILNTLLGVLNERTFRRGHTRITCPLRVCVGASNALPDDPQLAAFADRFLVRTFVKPVPDSQLEDLLEAGSADDSARSPTKRLSLDDVTALSDAAEAVDLGAVRGTIAEAIRILRGAGIDLSDRRMVRLQRLVAAAAALEGRDAATAADLWPITFVLPTEGAQELGRERLKDLLSASANRALGGAALEASSGLQARADQVVRHGESLLAESPGEAKLRAWKLRLEATARDIDASFSDEQLTPALRALRASIVARLGGDSSAQEPAT